MGKISSMTGFASGTSSIGGGVLSVDLKSVNHRNLDLQFRIAEEFRFLEPQFRKLIIQKISRGKIDCRINFKNTPTEKNSFTLNKTLIKNISNISASINHILPDAQPLSVNEILRWPGVIIEDEEPIEEFTGGALELFSETLKTLVKDKNREGYALGEILLDRLQKIQNLISKIEPLLPDTMVKLKQRISKKLEDASLTIDQDRLQQELILYAAKTDVDEELHRLKVHLEETKNICLKGGVCGKRLDFLAQELNRETNTLNAKSLDLNITQFNMEIKTLVEQLREQIQNIE